MHHNSKVKTFCPYMHQIDLNNFYEGELDTIVS